MMSLLLKRHTTMWKWLWHFFFTNYSICTELTYQKTFCVSYRQFFNSRHQKLLSMFQACLPLYSIWLYSITVWLYTLLQSHWKVTVQIQQGSKSGFVFSFPFANAKIIFLTTVVKEKFMPPLFLCIVYLKVPHCAHFQVPSFSLDSLGITASIIRNINLIGLWMQIRCTKNKSPFTQSITGIS